MSAALIIIGFALLLGLMTIADTKEDRALGFAVGAAIGAGAAGGGVWLWSWLAAGGWVWIFLLILTVPVWFWLGAALLCLLMHIAGAVAQRS